MVVHRRSKEEGKEKDLVNKLQNREFRHEAASALWQVAIDGEKAKLAILAEENAIKRLVDLLNSGLPVGKENAAGALQSLALCQGNISRIVQANAMPGFIRLLEKGTDKV